MCTGTHQNIELMTFVLTWCVSIFVGCLATPTFLVDHHYTKNQKNLFVENFNYFSYTCTIQIGPNWYVDTGVCNLEVVIFKANSS